MRPQTLIVSAALLAGGCTTRTVQLRQPLVPQVASQASVKRSAARQVPPAFERQVQNAVEAGDGDLEVRAWQRQLMRNPADTETRLRLAARFADHGAPELAAEHYRIAVTHRPADAAIRLRLAAVLESRQLTAEALESLEAALAVPELAANSSLWSQTAILRDELGQEEAAEQAHRRAIELSPSSGALHNNLGYQLLERRRPSDAIAEFREALRLEPRSGVARGNLALALASLKDAPEARREALLHWESMGGPAFAHNNLAAALIEQGSYDAARKELEEALRVNPSMPEALGNLRTVAERDGGSPSVRLKRRPVFWSRPLALLRRIFFSAEPAPPVAARRLDR